MLKQAILALALAGGLAASPAALADKAPIYKAFGSELAVGGYDPVAYFKEGAPVRGDKSLEFEHAGARWRFASAENLAAFKADPNRYAPQYGGYCAWAVSQGYTAKGDPKNWKIVNGRLYLNYNDEIQTRWEKDVPGFITKADANWPTVLKD
jgi:YHS domain-containing protein